MILFFTAEYVLSIKDRGGVVGAGETRCELIMSILDSPRVKGIVL